MDISLSLGQRVITEVRRADRVEAETQRNPIGLWSPTLGLFVENGEREIPRVPWPGVVPTVEQW